MRLALCAAGESIAYARVLELPAEPPEWVDLLAQGEIEARDGRRWTLADAAAVLAASRTRAGSTDLAIDWEHQGHHTATNGQPAPAGGWIKELRVEGGVIQGRVDWTGRAADQIRSREYRYLSPTFLFDKNTKRVRALTGAGLTNNPALDLPALATDQPEADELMNDEQLKKLREALGLAADADVPAILAAVAVMATNSAALAKVAEKVGLAKDAAGEAILAAAHKAPAAGEFVPRSEYDALAARLTTLETETTDGKATAAVDAAIEDGKVTPAQREWALGYARPDAEGFAKYVEATPAIVRPGRTGAGAPGSQGDPEAALTADELATCRMIGVTAEQFKESRKEIMGRSPAG